jgi:dihydroorotate dehydrogenase electron transfer subunit
MFKYIECIDANTSYCPCKLSEVGECLICSHLNGGKFCECTKYSGLCIYQEYVWNGEKSKVPRRYELCDITEMKYIREEILLIKIKVDHELALQLNHIGAYVFLKNADSADSFGTPISILNSDVENNKLTVAIKVIGVKTKILEKCKETIMLKGPFWNGIQGQLFIKNLKNEKCLILGRGIGLAPAILAAKKISERNNQIFAFLEKGRNTENYFKDYFEQLKCTTESISIMGKDNIICHSGMEHIIHCIEQNGIQIILSAGNDIFHKRIINYLYKRNHNLKFATVNNSTICCGEGNCGSCIQSINNQQKIKTCKLQYNPLEYFLER